MFNKSLILLILFTIITVSISYAQENLPPLQSGMIREWKIGIKMKQIEDQKVAVLEVFEGKPAAVSGIKKGDIIVSIDNNTVNKMLDVYRALDNYIYTGEIEIVINRKNKKLAYRLKPIYYDQFVMLHNISNILLGGKTLNLVVIVDKLHHYNPEMTRNKDWIEGQKNATLQEVENYFSVLTAGDDNFSILDRRALNHAINEQQLQQSGLISEKAQNTFERLGATHILLVDYIENEDKNYTQMRLIELRTNKVLGQITVVHDSKN